MYTVEKDGVRKNVKTENELGMYVSAGWKKVQSKEPKEIKEETEKPERKEFNRNN